MEENRAESHYAEKEKVYIGKGSIDYVRAFDT